MRKIIFLLICAIMMFASCRNKNTSSTNNVLNDTILVEDTIASDTLVISVDSIME